MVDAAHGQRAGRRGVVPPDIAPQQMIHPARRAPDQRRPAQNAQELQTGVEQMRPQSHVRPHELAERCGSSWLAGQRRRPTVIGKYGPAALGKNSAVRNRSGLKKKR